MDAREVWPWVPLVFMLAHRGALWLAWRRSGTREPARVEDGGLPPVTWLRPLKHGVPGLEEKLERFLASLAPDDQAVFGVEPGSEEARLCAALAGRDSRVLAIECDRAAAANPKVAKLLAMSPHARHERWILADAEARIDAEFARAFRADWQASGADVLTCGYRFVGMRTIAQRLDALPLLQTLWPGLELVRAFGVVRFTLGACTAFRRRDVESIGGWESLAGELAEDQQFGARLSKLGRTVRLSAAVIELESEPMSWRAVWRHQRRVAVTYRAANPAGAFGMVLTHGFALCALAAVLWPGWRAVLAAAIAAGVHIQALRRQARRVGAESAGAGLALAADLLETACWALGWVSSRVWWSGKWRAITYRGQMTPDDDARR